MKDGEEKVEKYLADGQQDANELKTGWAKNPSCRWVFSPNSGPTNRANGWRQERHYLWS